jgi:hypothetical protein
MAKNKGGAVAPQISNTDDSWLDEAEHTPEMVKVLSLRPGDITLQDGRVLKYKKWLEVKSETADWLQKTYPGFIERL